MQLHCTIKEVVLKAEADKATWELERLIVYRHAVPAQQIYF
jgi:hypothetical protein